VKKSPVVLRCSTTNLIGWYCVNIVTVKHDGTIRFHSLLISSALGSAVYVHYDDISDAICLHGALKYTITVSFRILTYSAFSYYSKLTFETALSNSCLIESTVVLLHMHFGVRSLITQRTPSGWYCEKFISSRSDLPFLDFCLSQEREPMHLCYRRSWTFIYLIL
jgi:hypothetical protein